jgi:hypothetical protein
LIQSVSNTSRAIIAVVITSCAVKQPAVLGSTGTPSVRSICQKVSPPSVWPSPLPTSGGAAPP